MEKGFAAMLTSDFSLKFGHFHFTIMSGSFKLPCTHKTIFKSDLERFVPCNILKPIRKSRRICTLGKQLHLFMS